MDFCIWSARSMTTDFFLCMISVDGDGFLTAGFINCLTLMRQSAPKGGALTLILCAVQRW
jgi:hypothetical protein